MPGAGRWPVIHGDRRWAANSDHATREASGPRVVALGGTFQSLHADALETRWQLGRRAL
jgi:hypothetical protein